MSVAALVAWIVTAAGGLLMLTIWVRGGGLRSDEPRPTRFQRGVILGHFGLAAAGLVLWLVYATAGTTATGWIALVLLLPVASLGIAMFVKWLGGRGSTDADAQAEQAFPTMVVAGHGIAAVATLLLVIAAVVAV